MPVPCPYCETTLEGGHVDVTAWGQTFGVGLKCRWQRDGAGLFEYRKILGWFDRRPAGLCPSCGAVSSPLSAATDEADEADEAARMGSSGVAGDAAFCQVPASAASMAAAAAVTASA